jgi:hypothetical protein
MEQLQKNLAVLLVPAKLVGVSTPLSGLTNKKLCLNLLREVNCQGLTSIIEFFSSGSVENIVDFGGDPG